MDLCRLYENLIRSIFTFLAETRKRLLLRCRHECYLAPVGFHHYILLVPASHASSAGDMMAVPQTPLSVLHPAAPSYIAAWRLSRFLAHIAALCLVLLGYCGYSVFSRWPCGMPNAGQRRACCAGFMNPPCYDLARRTPTGGWQG